MKVEVALEVSGLDSVRRVASKLEALGCHGVVTGEGSHDPFLPLLIAAEHTKRLTIGTAIAVAFARSPMVTAYTAWDLQAASRGRFLLGLGTQVKGHNERRFSVPWSAPGPRIREYILALRAIWNCWQNRTTLDFRGQHYTHTLMPEAWSPDPIEHPHIPIYISAVNPFMCRLAGELCDGIRLHPISSPSYTREAVLPSIIAAAQKAGRSLSEIDICCLPIVATGADERELAQNVVLIKRQLARYASTRTYHSILEHHGHGDLVPKLHAMSLEGKWQDMGGLISDELVDAIAVVATHDRLADKIKNRWGNIANRVTLRLPVRDDADEQRVRALVSAVAA